MLICSCNIDLKYKRHRSEDPFIMSNAYLGSLRIYYRLSAKHLSQLSQTEIFNSCFLCHNIFYQFYYWIMTWYVENRDISWPLSSILDTCQHGQHCQAHALNTPMVTPMRTKSSYCHSYQFSLKPDFSPLNVLYSCQTDQNTLIIALYCIFKLQLIKCS